MVDTLDDDALWLAYWDEEFGFAFLHPSMRLSGEVADDGRLRVEDGDCLIYGPYVQVAPGNLAVRLWATPWGGAFRFDCVGTTHLGEALTLAEAVFEATLDAMLDIQVDAALDRVEFRVFALDAQGGLLRLHGLHVRHRGV